jgi:hypothetical protein
VNTAGRLTSQSVKEIDMASSSLQPLFTDIVAQRLKAQQRQLVQLGTVVNAAAQGLRSGLPARTALEAAQLMLENVRQSLEPAAMLDTQEVANG